MELVAQLVSPLNRGTYTSSEAIKFNMLASLMLAKGNNSWFIVVYRLAYEKHSYLYT
jgi:hypothetical protein